MLQVKLSYQERAKLCSNASAKALFHLMEKKKSNLCFNPDVTSCKKLLSLADELGPYISVLKTHVDILEDFSPSFIEALIKLSKKHEFLIFEDRKFADIGHTVSLQYSSGIYKIANWADVTNAHSVPGPGVIEGLKKIGEPKGRGLLLLAEMSSKGTLAQGAYTEDTIKMANLYPDFVIGFIAMKKISADPRHIHLTPGVKKEIGQDSLGQQYKTPESVIYQNHSDMIIVGRGIYEASHPKQEASEYQTLGWEAYLRRLT